MSRRSDRFEAEFGQRPQVLVGDITDRVCQGLASETEGVDILVNNVGVYRPTELAQASAEHCVGRSRQPRLNFYMAQASWIIARNGHELIQGYVTCDQVCADKGQPINRQNRGAHPHWLRSALHPSRPHRQHRHPGQLANSIDLETAGTLPTGRPGEVDEIAAAVVYLASSEAAYVSGTNVNVAGSWAPASARYGDGL